MQTKHNMIVLCLVVAMVSMGLTMIPFKPQQSCLPVSRQEPRTTKHRTGSEVSYTRVGEQETGQNVQYDTHDELFMTEQGCQTDS